MAEAASRANGIPGVVVDVKDDREVNHRDVGSPSTTTGDSSGCSLSIPFVQKVNLLLRSSSSYQIDS